MTATKTTEQILLDAEQALRELNNKKSDERTEAIRQIDRTLSEKYAEALNKLNATVHEARKVHNAALVAVVGMTRHQVLDALKELAVDETLIAEIRARMYPKPDRPLRKSYSGVFSTKFWALINGLPKEEKYHMYDLGVKLQNLESSVFTRLHSHYPEKVSLEGGWKKWV